MEGGVGFLRAGARPATATLVEFIDEHRERFGVEPICRLLSEHGLKISPSTYYAAKKRGPSPRKPRGEAVKWRSSECTRKPVRVRRRQDLDPAQPRRPPRSPLDHRAA